mmetsp:Transcript_19943/g.50974  ORF Transcript_19943/g.50974 Transcript_19943/m.50974 type:complete len:222 (+) Transcript_19943:1641-2306(+)
MSFQENSAMGFSVILPSSQMSREMRCAAWSMRRPVMRISLLHSVSARWNGSTLLTKSKSAESISSTSPYFCSNSSRVVTSAGIFHSAGLPYFSSTSFAQVSVSGKRWRVSIATRFMPFRTSGKCSLISATKTLSVASQAVAKTTFLPSLGRCASIAFLKLSTLGWRCAGVAKPHHCMRRHPAGAPAGIARIAILRDGIDCLTENIVEVNGWWQLLQSVRGV